MQWLSFYEPVNHLKSVEENVWIADGGITAMAMYGVHIPFTTRMTVVRLNDGQLWVHSPIAYTPELAAQLDALGEVSHLVSPNMIHYAHIPGWAEHYPNARTWASPGVRERAQGQGIDVWFSDFRSKIVLVRINAEYAVLEGSCPRTQHVGWLTELEYADDLCVNASIP